MLFLAEENNKTEDSKKDKSLDAEQGSSQATRRARKSKQEAEQELGVTTRGMAARRAFLPGTNPIFAPDPGSDGPGPAKSPRVSRSSERAQKSGNGEPEEASTSGSRMCLRSSTKQQK